MSRALFRLAAVPRAHVRAFSTASQSVPVVIVGCGVPKRGMGWYHAKNLLDGEVQSGRLAAIVEPFFLGPAGRDTPAGKTFAAFKDTYAKPPHSVAFLDSVAAMDKDKLAKGAPGLLALISGRTADNPRLLREVIDRGATHVYLEKPGAPSVPELEEMATYAAKKNVPVFMGYNKNVTKYVTLAREFEAKTPGAMTTFIHNNAYKENELPECFERNAEGMLKNMAVHELALLVTFYGVKADNIVKIDADRAYSRLLTLTGPSTGKKFTDFASVGFTITTSAGKTVAVKANRTGGSFSEAVVSVNGVEKFKSVTPDKELEARVKVAMQKDPDQMPYFPLQHDDYIELKKRACTHILQGKKGTPPGMADIGIAIETLKVAEKLKPELEKKLA